MTKIPKVASPALNKLKETAQNRSASPAEKAQNAHDLNKTLTTLKKRSPKWAIILTLLATGSIAAATWYAGLWGKTLTPTLLAYGQKASETIKSVKLSDAAMKMKRQALDLKFKMRKAIGMKNTFKGAGPLTYNQFLENKNYNAKKHHALIVKNRPYNKAAYFNHVVASTLSRHYQDILKRTAT